MVRFLAFPFFSASCLFAQAQYAPANTEWNRPVEPFRIAGNLYYVGTADLSSFLLVTPEGHILIDSGSRETVPFIEANLKKLGFKLDDVRLLLISHGHYDHVGGMAELKQRTKARLLANPVEIPLLARGGRGDFAFKDTCSYPPVQPDGTVHDGEAIALGGTVLTAHFTPGHTKGSASWITTIEDGGHTYRVVIASSLSTPGYRLVNNPDYPEIVADYEASIAKLRALPCDIFLSLHSWDFALHAKIAALNGNANPFVDPEGYRRFLDKAEASLHLEFAKQKQAPAG